MALPRLRLACLAWRVFHCRQSHGFTGWRQSLDRRPLRPLDVPLALQAARIRAARADQGDAGYARAPDHPAHRAAREAALSNWLAHSRATISSSHGHPEMLGANSPSLEGPLTISR